MRFRLLRAPRRALLGTTRRRRFAIVAAILATSTQGAAAQSGVASSRWTVAPLALAEAAKSDQPGVFGTVPLPVKVRPTSTRWSRIMRASLNQPALHRLVAGAASLTPREQAAYIQQAVNGAVRTARSSHNCADDGYWAAAGETLTRGVGDCIDIAIVKMEALRLLGVPPRDLYLTTGYADAPDPFGRGREAAALLVRLDDGFWLLTEHSAQVIAASGTEYSAVFAPVVTYGVGRTWVHGRLVKPAEAPAAALVAAANPVSSTVAR